MRCVLDVVRRKGWPQPGQAASVLSPGPGPWAPGPLTLPRTRRDPRGGPRHGEPGTNMFQGQGIAGQNQGGPDMGPQGVARHPGPKRDPRDKFGFYK